ncbi:MAG: acetyltransferase [Planctomycetes bacterium]|nr:acetyltransferase [Planctomycetota bacterium]
MQSTRQRVIVLGAGGHARVLLDALLLLEWDVLGVTAPAESSSTSELLGVNVIGDGRQITRYSSQDVQLVNGVGSVGDVAVRRRLFESWQARGYRFATVVHPSVIIARDVTLDDGVQIMAGAVIQTGCHIGANAIINTSSSIDHDCRIGAHCHVAPGTTLSGNVEVGDRTHLGSGAVVIQGVQIGADALIAAGAVVTRDVEAGQRVQGVPARVRRAGSILRDCA